MLDIELIYSLANHLYKNNSGIKNKKAKSAATQVGALPNVMTGTEGAPNVPPAGAPAVAKKKLVRGQLRQ